MLSLFPLLSPSPSKANATGVEIPELLVELHDHTQYLTQYFIASSAFQFFFSFIFSFSFSFSFSFFFFFLFFSFFFFFFFFLLLLARSPFIIHFSNRESKTYTVEFPHWWMSLLYLFMGSVVLLGFDALCRSYEKENYFQTHVFSNFTWVLLFFCSMVLILNRLSSFLSFFL